MTVPFILAFGVGVANIRSDRSAEADSFGLVALCSVGPILSVLLLGLFSSGQHGVVEISSAGYTNTAHVGAAFFSAMPTYMGEVALALAPVVVIFLLFHLFSLRLSKRSFVKICIGLMYTYIGLVLFLTGVNVGFSSLGAVLGEALSSGWTKHLLIPISALVDDYES